MDSSAAARLTAPAQADGETKPARLLSLDAFRGIVMLLLAFFDAPNDWTSSIIEAHPPGTWPHAIAQQFRHFEWRGLALWDMIQPSFMFAVGASVAFSYAAHVRRGNSFWTMFVHASYRSLLLILLGVFLRSIGRSQTYWTFEDVVTQIGLGYVPLFLLWNCTRKLQLSAVAGILLVYWALFAAWPAPAADFDYASVNGAAFFEGFESHWNRNVHPAHAFDAWWLNLFPRSEPFAGHPGGYNTLNFVPSLATMLLGLIAGEVLRSDSTTNRKLMSLLLAGVICLAAGVALDALGACPNVKRIWTPSFALLSGGLCLLTLSASYAVIDVAGYRRWAFPAVVIGMNPLAAYVMIHLAAEWIVQTLHLHFGERMFAALGAEYQPMLENWSVGLTVWLVCYWMYRRKIFLRI